MNKALIITYYWPPSGGSGVQRWLKFVKYLPQLGWTPVVYTPDNPSFALQDELLLKDVPEAAEIVKRPIWEPYGLHKKVFGRKDDVNRNVGIIKSGADSGWKNYVANWIRGNFFIPDPKRYWVKPSVKFLTKYIKENDIDVVITTGPPHSMHMIGLGLKKAIGIPWIADFRDPFSQLDLLKSFHITKFNMNRIRKIEREILDRSDVVLTVSHQWKRDFEQLGAKRVEVITNGYDTDDFGDNPFPEKFIISHFGLLNHLRNPSSFWKALEELIHEEEGFKDDLLLQLGGSLDQVVIEEMKSCVELHKRTVFFDYLPHEEVIAQYGKSAMLLLLIFNSDSGQGNIPGKLFEYLAASRPIIGFGPKGGDSEQIINETDSGKFFSYNAGVSELKKIILEFYSAFKEKRTSTHPEKVEMYSRKSLAQRLIDLMSTLSSS